MIQAMIHEGELRGTKAMIYEGELRGSQGMGVEGDNWSIVFYSQFVT